MLPHAVLVTNKSNIRYFSGFSGTAGYLVLVGSKGFLFTDARYHLVAKKVLPSSYTLVDITNGFGEPFSAFLRKHRIKKLGIEGNHVSVRMWKYLKEISRVTLRGVPHSVTLTDIGEALDQKRMVKRPGELAHIGKAQRITDQIFAMLKKWLTPGQSEKDIAWKIACLARDLGADDLSFPPIIGINENSASPHHHNTEKKLKRGDMVLIDMGVIYRGYCSDMTRVIFTKPPTPEQAKIYELVKTAQETAQQKLKAGVKGSAADDWARDVIVKAGFGPRFGHSLGHGVGLDVHELPNLSKKYSGLLPEHSVVTTEPGVYLPGKFGIRLEDMVVITKTGARNLTRSPKELKSAIISI